MSGISRLLVHFSELCSARASMNAAMARYDEALETMKSAANNLASVWEGEGQVAFKDNQERAFGWYGQIGQVAHEISDVLAPINETFESTESEVASMIRS